MTRRLMRRLLRMIGNSRYSKKTTQMAHLLCLWLPKSLTKVSLTTRPRRSIRRLLIRCASCTIAKMTGKICKRMKTPSHFWNRRWTKCSITSQVPLNQKTSKEGQLSTWRRWSRWDKISTIRFASARTLKMGCFTDASREWLGLRKFSRGTVLSTTDLWEIARSENQRWLPTGRSPYSLENHSKKLLRPLRGNCKKLSYWSSANSWKRKSFAKSSWILWQMNSSNCKRRQRTNLSKRTRSSRQRWTKTRTSIPYRDKNSPSRRFSIKRPLIFTIRKSPESQGASSSKCFRRLLTGSLSRHSSKHSWRNQTRLASTKETRGS